jgi:hypothetical protein
MTRRRGNFYNGYSWDERLSKYDDMLRRMASGALPAPRGPCRLCGDPGDGARSVRFEYHDEDYSLEYSWAEPAAYVLCHHCHVRRVHMRFAQPAAWHAYLAHVRRGGYARDLGDPAVRSEVAAFRDALRSGAVPHPLKRLRAYAPRPGTEWFASLSLDWEDMLRPETRPRP